jgi:hypothetical protein
MHIALVVFFLVTAPLWPQTLYGAAGEPGSLASLVTSFSDQIGRSVPAKGSKSVLLLPTFDNQTNAPRDLVAELFRMVKETLQEKGYRVLEPASDAEINALSQRLKGEEHGTYLVKGVVSETAKKLVLGARIFLLKDNSVIDVVLASTTKDNARLIPSAERANLRAITLQEIFKSDPLPLKVLDVSVTDLGQDRMSLLLLTATDLHIYTLESNRLSLNVKISVPVDPETKPSRDPRGSIWSYRYQNKDYLVVTTHRSGGAHVLREDRGTLTFTKISSDWVLGVQVPTKPVLLSTKLLPGRNYFSGDLSVLDGETFFKFIDERAQADEPKGADLSTRMALLGRIKPCYQLTAIERAGDSGLLLVSADVDGHLRFYDARLREQRVYKDPVVGACLRGYFDPVRNTSYLLVTSGNPPGTTDFLSLSELKDGEPKPVTRSPSYRGSIEALGIGGLNGGAPLVAAIVASSEGPDTESTVYVFKLTSNP